MKKNPLFSTFPNWKLGRKTFELLLIFCFSEFNQWPYIKDLPDYGGFDSSGYIYIPSSGCRLLNCKLLVFLHGCTGGKEYQGPNVIMEAGFMAQLESRQMVGLFPQIKRNEEKNPYGCWNFFGYIPESEYYTKAGLQIRTLYRMIHDLSATLN